MKITELQLNDWVLIIDDDTNDSFVGRVTAIDIELENINVKRKGEETAYPFSIDCTEPIPLTLEILEKNGFKDEGYFARLDMDGYRILCDTKNVAVFHNEHTDMDVPICYVHELQHALKLCGIELEIKL